MGRFSRAGSPTKPPSARRIRKYEKKMAAADRKTANLLIKSMNAKPKNQKIRKDKSSSLRNPQNRSQEAFKSGKISRQAGFVPYTRHGFANQSVGFNAGARVLPNYRISGGVYLKVTNIDKTKREKAIRKADDKFMSEMTQKVSPSPVLDLAVKRGLTQFRRNAINKIVGGERMVTKSSVARLSTDMNAMPSLTIEYNRKDPRSRKKKRTEKARRSAQWAYNDMVMKSRGTNTRAQRRGK